MGGNELTNMIQPSVESNKLTLGQIFLGLTKQAGEAAITRKLAEQNPPSNKEQLNVDTANGELNANKKMRSFFASENPIVLGIAVIAIVGSAYYLYKALR